MPHSNLLRKHMGYLSSILGSILIVLGLTIYLNGPTKAGTTVWQHNEGRTYRADTNEFVYYRYSTGLPETPLLIPQVDASVSIIVEQRQETKMYFMNETQYSKLRNDTGFSTEIEELRVDSDNFGFQPDYNVSYYVVLKNIANETETVSIKINNTYTIQVFDYVDAFRALNLALVGGVIFTISFAFGNFFDELLRRLLNWPIFPGVEKYKSEKEIGIVPVAWPILAITILLILFVVFTGLNQVAASELPPPIIPLFHDILIRLGLFFFSAGC